jgi:DNA-binding transcriptional LysR family regulator
MELRHLRYFVAVAEEENVTHAAARLHVSQPPLTRQIHELEEEVGVAFFERTGRSIRLTEAGFIFLQEARAILERVESARALARAAASGRGIEVHVGYAPSPARTLLPAFRRRLRELLPAARLTLHDQASPEMLDGLRSRTLHAALMMQPSAAAARGLVFTPLVRQPLGVLVPRANPLARRRHVSVDEALAQPAVVFARAQFPDYHDMLRRVFGRRVRQFAVAEECDSGASLMAAVESGAGIALVPRSVAEAAGRRLCFIPLAGGEPPAAVLGIACLAGARSPVVARLIEAAQQASGVGG